MTVGVGVGGWSSGVLRACLPERAVRDDNLDHVRDLQFGGTDPGDDPQWLERSANREVGAQSEVHRGRFDYVPTKGSRKMTPKSHVSKVSLEVGGR